MKSHRTDGVSLTFGLIFLGIVIFWLFDATINVGLPDIGWFLAGALILFGVIGLVSVLRADRGKRGNGVGGTGLD